MDTELYDYAQEAGSLSQGSMPLMALIEMHQTGQLSASTIVRKQGEEETHYLIDLIQQKKSQQLPTDLYDYAQEAGMPYQGTVFLSTLLEMYQMGLLNASTIIRKKGEEKTHYLGDLIQQKNIRLLIAELRKRRTTPLSYTQESKKRGEGFLPAMIRIMTRPLSTTTCSLLSILLVSIILLSKGYIIDSRASSKKNNTNFLAKEELKEERHVAYKRIAYENSEKGKLSKLFSSWDGSNHQLEKLVKQNLHDPGSYEHIKTQYRELKEFGDANEILVWTEFRAKNKFGAKIKNRACIYQDINTGEYRDFSIGD